MVFVWLEPATIVKFVLLVQLRISILITVLQWTVRAELPHVIKLYFNSETRFTLEYYIFQTQLVDCFYSFWRFYSAHTLLTKNVPSSEFTLLIFKTRSRMLGRTSVESRCASYRDNQNFTIKTSSLNVNVKTCIGNFIVPQIKSYCMTTNNIKSNLLTTFQYCQYFDLKCFISIHIKYHPFEPKFSKPGARDIKSTEFTGQILNSGGI